MAGAGAVDRTNSRRKSVLELAPLERDCMKVLWPLGEATVRQIRDELAAVRPRAYTTIMTIMDRLERKGVVARRKLGRAYLYQPNVTAEQARAFAVGQLVGDFFGGSTDALQAHLAGVSAGVPAPPVLRSEPRSEPLAARSPRSRKASSVPRERAAGQAVPAGRPAGPATRIDESLL
jgi:predicted transcriptional regulator